MQTIFALGSNGSGQLGLQHKEDVSVPRPVTFHSQPDSQVAQIAAGGNHTLVLFKDGSVAWSGDSSSGACGIGSTSSAPVFLPVKLTKDGQEKVGEVALIAATWEASILVAKDSQGRKTELYTLGVGQKGELGAGELMVRTPTATRIKDFPPQGTEIMDLHACMGHVVAVLSNGEAYGWGNCRKGQIGGEPGVVHAPRKVEGVGFPVRRAVCAKETTCFFGNPESGNVKVLGADKHSLLSDAPSTAPPWKDVGAAWGSFYMLTQGGQIENWGRNDHGQLAPQNLPAIGSIAAGSEHVVALSEEGDVLTWGWGEHGNCGPQVENNDVKGRWNVIASSKFIPKDASIDYIGAGCATSWVCVTLNG